MNNRCIQKSPNRVIVQSKVLLQYCCHLLASRIFIRFSSSNPKHYDALDVKTTASRREIRAAFIRLSKKYHPDKCSDESSHERFQRIKEAYDVLGSKNKRYEYDYQRIKQQHPEMPTVDHFESKYYTDGTFWMGPKDHEQVKRRFTNVQVVVLLVAFGFFGGLAQLWIVKKFRNMAEASTEEMHRNSLEYIAEVTKKRASGSTTAQKHLAAYRAQLLAADEAKSGTIVENGDAEEIVDTASNL